VKVIAVPLHPKTIFSELKNKSNGYNSQPKAYKPKKTNPPPKPISFIFQLRYFKASLTAYETNHFVSYLINLFGVEVASELVSRYFIGTSNHFWKGATVFWQIDTQAKSERAK
jgi:hypothetical protein